MKTQIRNVKKNGEDKRHVSLKNIVYASILIVSMLIVTFQVGVYYARSQAVSNPGTTYGPGDVDTYSYTIFKEGSTYYAKNGTTRAIDYSGTNSSYIINTALSLSSTNSVFLKATEYLLDAPIVMLPNRWLYGEGGGNPAHASGSGWGTVLRIANNKAINAIEHRGALGQESGVYNLYLDGNKDNQVEGGDDTKQNAIYVENFESFWVQNVIIHNFYHYGIFLDSGAYSSEIINVISEWNRGAALKLDGADGNHIGGGYFAATTSGDEAVWLITASSNTFDSTRVGGVANTKYGIFIEGNSLDNKFINVYSSLNPADGIRIHKPSNYTTIIGGLFAENGENGISIAGSSYNIIKGAVIRNNNLAGIALNSLDGVSPTWNDIEGNIITGTLHNYGIQEVVGINSTIINVVALDASIVNIETTGVNTQVRLSWNGTTWIP